MAIVRDKAAEVSCERTALTLALSRRERGLSAAVPYIYRYATRRQFDDAQAAEWGCRWLSPVELQTFGRLSDPRRQSAFLLGRLLAKRLILLQCRARAISDAAAIKPAEIEIDSGLARGRRQRPHVSILGQALPWSLSIAHTERAVLVALACEPGVCVGVDLVGPAKLGPGFVELWFTAAERRQVLDSKPGLATRLWAIKEAVYKAAVDGKPFAPRSIEVLPGPDGGFVCRPDCTLSVWQTPHGETAAIAHCTAERGQVHVFGRSPLREMTLSSRKMDQSPTGHNHRVAGEIS